MTDFGIMIFLHPSNTSERKNKCIVTKVCITNQIISEMACNTIHSQIHSNHNGMASVLHGEHTGTIKGHFQAFVMTTFFPQLS